MNFPEYINFNADRFVITESEFRIRPNEAELNKLRKRLTPGVGIGIDRGVLRHYGIYIGDDLVIELNGATQGKNKSRLVRLGSFLVDGKSSDVKIFHSLKFSPDIVILQAKNALNATKIPYNLFKNNCEHFMNEILNGEHTSHQVAGLKTYLGLMNYKLANRFLKSQEKNAQKFSHLYGKFLQVG